MSDADGRDAEEVDFRRGSDREDVPESYGVVMLKEVFADVEGKSPFERENDGAVGSLS